MKAVVAVGNAFCGFQGACGRVLGVHSSGSFHSLALRRVPRCINEIGCLAGSAWMPLRLSAAGGFAPR